MNVQEKKKTKKLNRRVNGFRAQPKFPVSSSSLLKQYISLTRPGQQANKTKTWTWQGRKFRHCVCLSVGGLPCSLLDEELKDLEKEKERKYVLCKDREEEILTPLPP